MILLTVLLKPLFSIEPAERYPASPKLAYPPRPCASARVDALNQTTSPPKPAKPVSKPEILSFARKLADFA